MFSEKTDLYYIIFLFFFGRMQCCPNKRIYIRALFQHSDSVRLPSDSFDYGLKNYFWDWTKRAKPALNSWNGMECYLNSVTYIKPFSFFNWIGSWRNKPFFLDFNLKVFVPFLSLVKNTEYSVWNQHWKLTMQYNVVEMDWFTVKQINFYI